MSSRSRENCAVFRRLHRDGLLILPNAWDGVSARLIESLGAKAIATSSGAVSWAHGFADGHHLPVPMLVANVQQIARVIHVPLSVDVEGGYSDDPAAVAETVAAVIDAGAVGINLEDGTSPPELLCAKIESIKRTAARLGVDVFVNARVDVYLRPLVAEAKRVEETLSRAARYRAAGADGIFVPRLNDASEILTIAPALGLPLNVLAVPGVPPVSELAGLGVRRLSAGSGIAQASLARAKAVASAFLHDGVATWSGEGGLPHTELNALFS